MGGAEGSPARRQRQKIFALTSSVAFVSGVLALKSDKDIPVFRLSISANGSILRPQAYVPTPATTL